ncbi:MAG: transcriptional coactivator p15/PC4 family protein [Candidatus Omnitrophica bacterium]|nr:transcriptional coactivator p15/PC4 family protein [Candidatus Omnitrophota bacterium]
MNSEKTYVIKRGANENVRITLREYKGKQYVDIRLFYLPKNDTEMRPTKKGITIYTSELKEVAKGLKEIVGALPDETIV